MLLHRKIRLFVLLSVLAWVVADVLADRLNTTDWQQTLWVGVYPVNADDSRQSARYIAALKAEDFAGIEQWLQAEGERYGLAIAEPLRIRLGHTVAAMPPLPPVSGGWLQTTLWSLRLRAWANDHDVLPEGLRPDVRLFLLFYDPATHARLPHSLGLQKGLVGIVHAYAHERQAGSNRVVIAHELLHTLGATDKYDPASNQPRYPDGYAEPSRAPRYPQTLAEIMGGRIPLSPLTSDIPGDVQATRIGPLTATEIRWR